MSKEARKWQKPTIVSSSSLLIKINSATSFEDKSLERYNAWWRPLWLCGLTAIFWSFNTNTKILRFLQKKKKKKIRFRGRVLLKRDLGAQKKLDLKTESRVSLCMYKGALICGLFCRQAKLNLYWISGVLWILVCLSWGACYPARWFRKDIGITEPFVLLYSVKLSGDSSYFDNANQNKQ